MKEDSANFRMKLQDLIAKEDLETQTQYETTSKNE